MLLDPANLHRAEDAALYDAKRSGAGLVVAADALLSLPGPALT